MAIVIEENVPQHITRQMKIITDLLDNILGKGVVECEGTTLKVNVVGDTDRERFFELELKENIVMNVLYNWYNYEVKSENIGFCITAEDEMWGEIDLTGFVE